MGCSVLLAVQISSLIASLFGLSISIYELIKASGWTNIIISIYVLFFSLLLFVVEVYIPPFFRYFGFLMKNWGKGATYLLLGFLFFDPNDILHLITGVVFWVLAIAYFILSFIVKGIAKPLAQQTVTLSTTNADYYVDA